MESTHDFVKSIHQQQESSKKGNNKKDSENGGHHLPGKKHSTNK